MAAPLEDGDLLSERQDFKGGVAPIAKEDAECGQEREDEFDDERMVLPCRDVASAGQRLRTASPDSIPS